tara:strand:- start:1035 stop:1208 length:174 start_codon:yes stop_codon:yes gene_type:complete
MGHYEDSYFEIYQAVRSEDIKVEFDEQLAKMRNQTKHRFKTPKEMWEYAYTRVTNSN